MVNEMRLGPDEARRVTDPAEAAVGESRQRMSFAGSGAEYFRIWIVNVMLSIVTLGIYSAWAKVRAYKYLYGSTSVAGASFDYHARPLAILKGRLIAIGLVLAYLFGAMALPGLDVGILLVIGLLTPFLVVRSRMFNLRNTSYRNIRFGFAPAYGDAYVSIIGYGVLAFVTLGIMFPYAHYRRNRMLIDNTRYGSLEWHLDATGRGFYARYLWVSAFALVALVLLFALLPDVFDVNTNPEGVTEAGDPGATNGSRIVRLLAPAFAAVMIYLLILGGLRALIIRYTLDNTRIGEHRLRCEWGIPRLLYIYATNIIAIVLSLGLLIPWATVRKQRYQLNNTWIDLEGDLDEIIARQADEVSALGDEIGEAFDIDLGL